MKFKLIKKQEQTEGMNKVIDESNHINDNTTQAINTTSKMVEKPWSSLLGTLD